jgi:septal ring factor EnvC (AmiA/AmiB activator)
MKWNFKDCSSRADCRRICGYLAGPAVVLVASIMLAAIMLAAIILAPQPIDAGSQPGAASFVERLERLEMHVDRGERRTEELRAELTTATGALGRDAASLDTAERARRRVKRKIAGQLVAWERADRELRRAARYLGPGQAADTRVLLARAEPEAIGSQMSDIGVLKTIDTDVRRTRVNVADRAELLVEIAQSKGDTEAAEASRDEVVKEATKRKNKEKVDREMEDADDALENSVGMLLKNDTSRDFHRLKGTLLPPVSAEVTFGYGPRKQSESVSYVRHSGLTWKIEEKTSIKTVASGLVVYAGRFEGFGKIVIVDHGQEYHSLYAHLGKLSVAVGRDLERGAVIGTSGQTGSFEGPKLYFELRKDGQPIDPSPWFIQR